MKTHTTKRSISVVTFLGLLTSLIAAAMRRRYSGRIPASLRRRRRTRIRASSSGFTSANRSKKGPNTVTRLASVPPISTSSLCTELCGRFHHFRPGRRWLLSEVRESRSLCGQSTDSMSASNLWTTTRGILIPSAPRCGLPYGNKRSSENIYSENGIWSQSTWCNDDITPTTFDEWPDAFKSECYPLLALFEREFADHHHPDI